MQFLLSYSHIGSGRKAKQVQKEISCNHLQTFFLGSVQRSAKRIVCGFKKFVSALAFLFCLALTGSCLVRFAYFLADLCIALPHFEERGVNLSHNICVQQSIGWLDRMSHRK